MRVVCALRRLGHVRRSLQSDEPDGGAPSPDAAHRDATAAFWDRHDATARRTWRDERAAFLRRKLGRVVRETDAVADGRAGAEDAADADDGVRTTWVDGGGVVHYDPTRALRVADLDADLVRALHTLQRHAARVERAHIHVHLERLTWSAVDRILDATDAPYAARAATIWAATPVRVADVRIVAPTDMAGSAMFLRAVRALLPRKVGARTRVVDAAQRS